MTRMAANFDDLLHGRTRLSGPASCRFRSDLPVEVDGSSSRRAQVYTASDAALAGRGSRPRGRAASRSSDGRPAAKGSVTTAKVTPLRRRTRGPAAVGSRATASVLQAAAEVLRVHALEGQEIRIAALPRGSRRRRAGWGRLASRTGGAGGSPGTTAGSSKSGATSPTWTRGRARRPRRRGRRSRPRPPPARPRRSREERAQPALSTHSTLLTRSILVGVGYNPVMPRLSDDVRALQAGHGRAAARAAPASGAGLRGDDGRRRGWPPSSRRPASTCARAWAGRE